jgi:hypothetical protein
MLQDMLNELEAGSHVASLASRDMLKGLNDTKNVFLLVISRLTCNLLFKTIRSVELQPFNAEHLNTAAMSVCGNNI